MKILEACGNNFQASTPQEHNSYFKGFKQDLDGNKMTGQL